MTAPHEQLDAMRAERDALAEKLADKRRVLLDETEMVATKEEIAERDAIRTYIESKHNGYDEASRKAMSMQRPATHLDALKDLIEENEALATMELRDIRAEVERVTKREADGVALYDDLLARERATVQVQRARAERAESELAADRLKLTRLRVVHIEDLEKQVAEMRDECARLRAAQGEAAVRELEAVGKKCDESFHASTVLKAVRERIAALTPPAPGPLPASGEDAKLEEPTYACDRCGKLRTKAQGGTIFTVCDACWDATTPKPAESAPEKIEPAWRHNFQTCIDDLNDNREIRREIISALLWLSDGIDEALARKER